jgi:hypothetical protein
MPGLDRRSQGTRDYLTVGSRGVNCQVERRVRGLLSMSCNAPDVHGHRGPRDLHRARALQRYVLPVPHDQIAALSDADRLR